MKLHVLLLIALATGIAACAEKEQVAAPAESETDTTEAVSEAATDAGTIVDEMDATTDEAGATFADVQEWRNEALLDHMHAHAEHLDDLNFALDDGNLERASTSAYWLSRHESIAGLPDHLQPFVTGLRDAARAVEDAEDLVTARAAAKGVGEACQACHDAADVSVD